MQCEDLFASALGAELREHDDVWRQLREGELFFAPLPGLPDRRRGEIYKLRAGGLARWTGRGLLARVCRDCPLDAKRQAHHADEQGRARRLCASCATAAGTKAVRFPCRDCPASHKREATFADEAGRAARLCGDCARRVGVRSDRFPCRDCPPGAQKQASYADECGRPKRLCARCAARAGTKTVRFPCRDCPEACKKEASYLDEAGRPRRLCAGCATRAGTKTVRFPCRDCPEGRKVQASFVDELGRPARLCARCAERAGTKPLARRGARAEKRVTTRRRTFHHPATRASEAASNPGWSELVSSTELAARSGGRSASRVHAALDYTAPSLSFTEASSSTD